MDSKERVCPVCGKTYTDYPALSRKDNETEICPQCGIDEAMEDFFLGGLNKEVDHGE